MTDPGEQLYSALVAGAYKTNMPIALLLTRATFHRLRANTDSPHAPSPFNGVPVHVIAGLRKDTVLLEDGTTAPV